MIRFTRSKVVTAGAAVLLTAGLAAGVAAQGGRPGRPGPGGPGRGPGLGLPIAQLGLSEAQQTQLRDVMERNRQEMKSAADRLGSAHQAQRNAIETVPLNEGLVRSTSDALATAETDVAILQARVYNDVFALLTPEQQTKARQLAAEREAKMKQRQQNFQNRPERRQKRQG